MKLSHYLIPVVLLATGLYAIGCFAWTAAAAPNGASITTVFSKVPEQSAVEAFTHHAEWSFPDYGKGKSLVSDRILDGFQAGPTLLVTADGSAIRWGFKYQEGSFESVVIGAKSGELKLLAAVDGITRLTNLSSSPINTMAEYEQRQKRSETEPAVTIFIHDESALKTYLPLFKRWLQANLMGFNTDCSKLELAAACKLAGQIAIPARIFVIAADGSLHGIPSPAVPASTVPLKSFVQ